MNTGSSGRPSRSSHGIELEPRTPPKPPASRWTRPMAPGSHSSSSFCVTVRCSVTTSCSGTSRVLMSNIVGTSSPVIRVATRTTLEPAPGAGSSAAPRNRRPGWPDTTCGRSPAQPDWRCDLKHVEGTTRAPAARAAVPVILVAFVALGLPDGLLGVAWPSMRATFDQPLAGLGQLLLVGTCGYLAVSAASGFLSDHFGTGAVLMGSACAGALAMLAFTTAPSWPLLLLGALALGAGNGGVDAGGNAYVALRHGPGTMNLIHGCYGIGATIGPLAMTAVLVAGQSWRVPYAGMLV